MSGQNGKETGTVSENPAPGEKGATESNEDDELQRVFDNEIIATDCILDALPDSEAKLCDDKWAYDVYISGKYVGTVYLVDQYSRRALTVEEICAQVQDIKNKFAQKGDQA